ncbi:hypothetical protein ACFQZ4_15615 [Catellatospora coxensis]
MQAVPPAAAVGGERGQRYGEPSARSTVSRWKWMSPSMQYSVSPPGSSRAHSQNQYMLCVAGPVPASIRLAVAGQSRVSSGSSRKRQPYIGSERLTEARNASAASASASSIGWP